MYLSRHALRDRQIKRPEENRIHALYIEYLVKILHALFSFDQQDHRRFLVCAGIISLPILIRAHKRTGAPFSKRRKFREPNGFARFILIADSRNHDASRAYIKSSFNHMFRQIRHSENRHDPRRLCRSHQMDPIHILPSAVLIIDAYQVKSRLGYNLQHFGVIKHHKRTDRLSSAAHKLTKAAFHLSFLPSKVYLRSLSGSARPLYRRLFEEVRIPPFWNQYPY